MASNEQLREWRALGVKCITLTGQDEISSVEFFPRGLLDSVIPGVEADTSPTDRPPPDSEGHANVPPAIARILSKGSVS